MATASLEPLATQGDLRYPGVKVKAGESPYDAAARLCKTRWEKMEKLGGSFWEKNHGGGLRI